MYRRSFERTRQCLKGGIWVALVERSDPAEPSRSGAALGSTPGTRASESAVETKLRCLAAGSMLVLPVTAGGCNTGSMYDQPKYEPLEPSVLFSDGRSSRPLVEGTVARGHLRIDHHFFEGRVDGELVAVFPEPVTREKLRRGQDRFNIFCTACHGEVGHGDGMAVQRGYPRPPSFHSDRLRAQPVGHLYDVISNGFGRMMGYGDQVPPADRWAIVAYVRALQRSQHATAEMLRAVDREALGRSDTGGSDDPAT